MSTTWSDNEIVRIIREDILLERLELTETGISAEQLKEDTLLLDESGIGLDSVDALDIVVAVQQIFGLEVADINKAFLEEKCRSIGAIKGFVKEQLGKKREVELDAVAEPA